MQRDRRVHGAREVDGGVDVVVVAVRAHHGAYPAAVDGGDDRVGVVGGVDHHHLPVVADHPDVVGDVEDDVVEAELPLGGHVVDPGHRVVSSSNVTTERSTSPRSMRAKLSSTCDKAIRSVTKASSGSAPDR